MTHSLRQRLLLHAVLLLAPSLGSAQSIQLADSTVLRVSAPQPSMMGAFPPWWRDSVTAVWVRSFTGKDHRPDRPLPPGVRATVALQILRDGKLRRARIGQTTSDVRLDSALIATSWEVMRTGGYPKFPVGVEGAGTEIELIVATSARGRNTGSTRDTIRPPLVGDLPLLSARCDSLLASPNKVERLTLRALLDSVPGNDERRGWALRTLTAMQTEFRAPGIFVASNRPTIFADYSRGILLNLPGLLRVVVDPTGHLTGAEIVVPSRYPGLDSVLLAMVHAADSAGAIPPPPSGEATATMEVRFEADRGDTHRGVPLGLIAFGVWGIDFVPVVQRMGQQSYPPSLRASGVGGRVELEFVVGADGRVVPSSLQVISAPHFDLSTAARTMILETRFQPATARGCAVPNLVRQAINFRP